MPADSFGQQRPPEIIDERPGVIEVTASAAVNYEPDRARVSFAVITFAETAAQATEDNAVKMKRIQDALNKMSGDRGRVQTTSFRLDPHYPPAQDSRGMQPKPDGYTARNMIEVRLRDVRSVGNVIDGVIAAGADNVSGLSFSLEDMSPVHHEALKIAYQNAEAQAETLATAAGKSLGALLSMRTPPASAVAPMMAEAAVMRVGTPIEAGTLSYSASVQVVFELR
jgi:uncharacterized protein YggE